jgi:spore coat polysaccharide biosynthesis predicted glycosyltransferase SpsG
MEKTFDELKEIFPESTTQLVSLNTRIPRSLDNMINESVGMIQTASRYQKVSKQMAVQILIEKGYLALKNEFESMDNEILEANEKVVSITPVTKPQQYTFNINSYYEMSNKSSYDTRKNEPQENKAEQTGLKRTIREKLGLK